jgi:hypothetical protein
MELLDGRVIDCVQCDFCGMVISVYSDEALEWHWDEEGERCMCLLCVEDIERRTLVERVGFHGLAQVRGDMDRLWAESDGPGLDLS